MTFYFLMFLIPVVLSLFPYRDTKALLFPVMLFFIFAVGLRDHVGMDWNNYLAINFRNAQLSFADAIRSSEPGYVLIDWLSAQLGWGVHGTNLVVALVFFIGLFSYAKTTANPFLAIAVAVPYLVIVVSMSAARQSIAIGVLFYLYAHWTKFGTVRKVFFIGLASLFHFSALLMLVFIALELRVETYKKVLVSLGLIAVAPFIYSADSISTYSDIYIGEGSIVSPGAVVHLALIAVPAIIYMLYRQQWDIKFGRLHLNYLFALTTIGALALLPFASTAVDRMSLYFYAVPIMIYANLPSFYREESRNLMTSAIVAVHFFQLWVWLALANNSEAYIPYQTLLF